MKTGLVLSGGGSKGAYEAGCIRALLELGYSFDNVVGTSIGALNALLVVQEDYDVLDSLWDDLSIDKVLATPVNLNISIDSILKQKNLIKPFFKSYINEKGADITPFINLINGLYKDEKAFSSNMKYGLVTVKFPSLQPLEITIDDMKHNDPIEYALCSASCFPAFPIHYKESQGYIDGGYYDNLPIPLCLNMGSKKIIAIELNMEPTHEYLLNKPNITFIRPTWDLQGFLDFTSPLLKWRKALGYLDTMKVFKKYIGYRYTFEIDSLDKSLARKYYNLVLKNEVSYNNNLITNKLSTSTSIITNVLKTNYLDNLDIYDYYIRAVEKVMEKNNYDCDRVYNLNEVTKEIYSLFVNNENQDIIELATYKMLESIINNLKENKGISTKKEQIFDDYYEALLYYLLSKVIKL
ncbi:MAG: patatin-like phospholipase family protein [Thomasclavelia sp.]|nr:patatin-like phospholipase family protein [Thomasclavelia sp.]